MIRHRTAKVDSTTLFYREAGDPDAPAILLLHGFPSSSHMFRTLIPLLADDYHLVAPDLPGFGFSDAPPREGFEYTFEHLAEVVERFTAVVGLERFALYVFDYGAPIGFRLALRHPERVTAIVSQNGNAYEEGLSPAWNPIRAYWSEPTPERRAALRDFLGIAGTKQQYLHGVSDAALVAPESYTLDAALLARAGNDEIQLDLFRDYGSNVALYPAFQRYLRTRPPVLAVWGRNDPFFLPAGAEAFRRDNPDAEVVFYDTGHFALETHAVEIAAAIDAFLKRKLPAASAGRAAQRLAAPQRGAGAAEGVAVVRRFYEALGRGDAPTAVSLLGPVLDWTEAERFPYYGGTWRTPEAVVQGLLAPLQRDWEEFSARPESFLVEGERVVALGAYGGRYRRTGRSMAAPFAHVWTVCGGRIVGFVQYTDTAKVLEALRDSR